MALVRHQQVLRLELPIDNSLLVEEADADNYFCDDGDDSLLSEEAVVLA